jgi:hypothetical protein
MSYEPREVKPNTGKLFVNNNKKSDKHADYTGSIKLENGKEYWLNMWINTSKAGGKYFSISIGNEKMPAGAPAYSAAHKPFPKDEHTQAKANAFMPVSPLDEDPPF